MLWKSDVSVADVWYQHPPGAVLQVTANNISLGPPTAPHLLPDRMHLPRRNRIEDGRRKKAYEWGEGEREKEKD